MAMLLLFAERMALCHGRRQHESKSCRRFSPRLRACLDYFEELRCSSKQQSSLAGRNMRSRNVVVQDVLVKLKLDVGA